MSQTLNCKTPRQARRALLARPGAIVLAAAFLLPLGACKKISDVAASMGDVTGSVRPATVPGDPLGQQRFISEWGARYDRRPDDKIVVLNYALGLRSANRHEQAIAVLQRAVIRKPNDLELLAAYGKALADGGRFQEAAQVLERAQQPEKPSWSIMSTQGSIADKIGNHAMAQQHYQEALKISPGEPSVLSNLGLSYALSRQLPEGERVLRQAVANPRADQRVRQNLALVLALQGKFGEAEDVLRQVLTPADAAANIASIRGMIAQSNTWREIQTLDGRPQRQATRPVVARRPAQ